MISMISLFGEVTIIVFTQSFRATCGLIACPINRSCQLFVGSGFGVYQYQRTLSIFCWWSKVVFLQMLREVWDISQTIRHVIDVELLLRMICLLFEIALLQCLFIGIFIPLSWMISSQMIAKFSLSNMLWIRHDYFS